MDEWIDRFADRLGEERMAPDEIGMALKLAREVAHGSERKAAPLSAYLAGVHAGRALAAGASRAGALGRALTKALDLLPDPEAPPDDGP